MNLEIIDDFEIEDLGIIEEEVYDIEIENNHNFFANDLLVHNSVYFCFDFVAKKFPNKPTEELVDIVNKFSKTIIEPEIKKIYEELASYMNVNENKMIMKQEKISEKFLTTGKKRYACLVWDDEGVRFSEPELKVTGIEIVRSSTPKAIKPFLKESIIKLLKDPNNFKQYINTVKQQFYKISPEEIAFPRSVSEVKKYYDKNSLFKKGCPIGVRAAIVYNEYLKREFIENEMIYDGEKIKFFYTITPNIFFNSNVFGYKKHIPNREHIIKFVDYNKQFDKVFYDVIRNICEKININIEKNQQTNLDLLF